MPQRAIGIAVAVAGLFLVIFLLLMRFDLRRATRTGPRWKRNLVLAGLFILSCLGCANNVIPGCKDRNRQVTCYAPPPPPASWQTRQSAGRLGQQAALLEKFAASEKLDAQVVEKVLATVKQDMAILESEEGFGELTVEERKNTVELREKIKKLVEKIEAKLPAAETDK